VGVAARPGSALRSPQAGQSRASVCATYMCFQVCVPATQWKMVCALLVCLARRLFVFRGFRGLSLTLVQMLQLPIEGPWH